MRVNILFSMDDIQLPQTAQDAIHALTAEWEIVTKVGTRQLIDAIVDPAEIPTIQAMITAQNPVIIGAWNQDGSQFDTTLYPYNPTELAIFSPTFTHGFAGWAERIVV